MKVVALQTDIVWEDPPANFERLRPQIAMAARTGARLVALPEMYACGFSMRASRLAEPPDGPSSAFLVEQARAHDVWLCGSLPEHPPGFAKPFNTLVLAAPDGQTFRYRKIHPFTFAGEHESYSAGKDFLTVEVEGLRCTFFICYDLRFADEFWATARGTDCYLVVANWPERRRRHWSTLLQARAIENQAYVVGVNRVGRGDDLDYTGDSCVVDPWGERLASAAGREAIVIADLDAEVVRDARKRFPVLNDRR